MCLYLDLQSNNSVNGSTVNVTISLVKHTGYNVCIGFECCDLCNCYWPYHQNYKKLNVREREDIHNIALEFSSLLYQSSGILMASECVRPTVLLMDIKATITVMNASRK